MKPENWITLGGGLLTAFCTVIGLYFGPKRAVRLALEQFREEKWWERKATAYDDIVRSAARLCSFHSNCLTTLSQGYRINEAWYAQCQEKNREAQTILETHRHAGGFLILGEAGGSINRILNSFDSDDEGEYGNHARISSVLRKEVEAIKECAARDLNIERHSP
ncbi:MAG TPA: hypothetical protein VMR62_19130 [Bryobacteraceae bacterium]|nr:hypothetical protein [Bryobacteraceae bacterium]